MGKPHFPNAVTLREPRLLVPGKKPLGPVTIDRAHWLGKYIQDAWIFQPNNWEANIATPALSLDFASLALARFSLSAESVTFAVTYTAGVKPRGNPWAAIIFDSTVRPIRGLSSSNTRSLGNQYTILNYGPISYSVGGPVGPAAGTDKGYMTYHSSGNYYHAAGNTYWLLGSSIGTTQYKHQAMAVVRNEANVYVYADGVLTASKLGPTSGSSTANFQYYQIGTSNGSQWLHGGLSYLLLVRKALSAEEIQAHLADEFGYLIPA